jgi:hypothetical protein
MDPQQLNYCEFLADKGVEIYGQKLAEELEIMKKNKTNFIELLTKYQYTKFYYGIAYDYLIGDRNPTLNAVCSSIELPDFAGIGRYHYEPYSLEISNWNDFWKTHSHIETDPDAVIEIRIVEIVPRDSTNVPPSTIWTFLKREESMKITILNCKNFYIRVEYM